MDLTGVFAGTFTAFKQRFGLLILISLIPTLVTVALVAVATVVAVGVAGAAVADPRSLWGTIPGLVIGGIVAIILIALATLKAQGMTTLAAYEIAQGQHPDLGGLWTRSRGFLPRMTAVIAIFFGVVILAYGLILALAFSMVGALDGRSGGRAAGTAALLFLLILALVPVSFYFQTKLLYTVPAIAIEQAGGIDGLKRSWSLTRGAFWRTFGYWFVGSLAVGTVSYVVSMVAQLPLVGLRRYVDSNDPSQILAGVSASLPLILVVTCLQFAVQLLTQPFLYAYVAYIFIDQVRRSELPPTPAYGGYGYPTGPQSGYYAPPNQYYGQPGQPYPPQPGTGYGQPGQGYQPPGQPPQQQPGGWQPPTPPQTPQG